MKTILVALSLAAHLVGMAQTAQLFRGGAGDGLAKTGYTQPSVAFWLGGHGDGFASQRFAQLTTAFWLGGEGDGAAKAAYAQPTTAFWLGGDGDGFAKNGYAQPSTGFWLGGPGDGHADSGYVQPSQNFWLGGIGDGWASTYIPNRALPVTFGDFKVSKRSATEALLQWDTKTEANSSYFSIERSPDAVNFSAIGRQTAAGNSNTAKQYQFVDAKVLQGNNYYRLKQVDRNGQFVYTPTRMLNFGLFDANTIKIYPNPASHVANVLLSGNLQNQHLVINMLDAKGNVVKQWKLLNNTQPQLQLNVSGLPKGSYLIHFSGKNINSTQKLLIQ
ncbi:MAG: T9SS C-terminal target domain-containing protein [Bacteroidetes bacterium]|nr:MAG: T9SS C-terminal target domain-containing protein [Bacteroidota bacterium]